MVAPGAAVGMYRAGGGNSRPYGWMECPGAGVVLQPMSDSDHDLAAAVEHALTLARRGGADQAQAVAHGGVGLSATVRLGEPETLTHHRSRGVSVTVYYAGEKGYRSGTASTTDLSAAALATTVEAALGLAWRTDDDPCAGLPDPDLLARDWPDLQLAFPLDLDPQVALAEARRCEAAALAVDPRLTNSEGGGVSLQGGTLVLGNSHGFLGRYETSRKAVSCTVLGEVDGAKERDGWYAASRDPADLATPEEVGRIAGERTVQRLGARRVPTTRAPVLFDSDAAATLLRHFAGAVSGTPLYRRTSFLADALDADIFAPIVTVRDEGRRPRGLGSAPFDAEGVTTRDRSLVEGGVLRGYLLDTYAARKLGTVTTGNAGGSHNLYIAPGEKAFPALLHEMGRGLLVTDLMGQGVNLLTGDYSRGAAGFWVEGGAIVHPVHEVTIASNLKEMFRHIVAIGSDLEFRSATSSPSLLIEEMTIAGC
jgi:PmbA protein